MDTELSTIILGVIFVIAIVLPFYLTNASIRRSRDIVKKALELYGKKSNLAISDHEIWNRSAIAIDAVRKKLLFIKKDDKSEQELEVDLSLITSCKVDKSSIGKTGSPSYRVIKVDLILQTQADKSFSIPIFDVLFDDPVESNFHLLLAKRWQAKVQEIIKPGHTKSAA